MDIEKIYGALIRKSWLIVLLVVLGGGIAGFVTNYTYVPMYQAETKLYAMNQDKIIKPGQSLTSEDFRVSQQIIRDSSEIVHNRNIVAAVMQNIKISEITEGDIDVMVSVSSQKDSNVMTLTAKWPDPYIAAAVASAMSNELSKEMKRLTNSNTLSIIEQAQVPDRPIPPAARKKIAIGLLFGLSLALGIIYITEVFDTTLRTVEDIEKGIKIRVVGIIPEHKI